MRSSYSLSWPKNFPLYMEPEISLLCPQEPTTGSYPHPDESSPHNHVAYLLFKIHFNIILPSVPEYIPFRVSD
jgi:hypothetical protein